MNSKEAFNELKREISVRGNLSTFQKRCFDIIQQDLDRLEKLEKENQELNTRYSILEILERADNNIINKLIKFINILKYNLEFGDLGEMQNGNMYRGYFLDCFNQQEYELLKEVLSND